MHPIHRPARAGLSRILCAFVLLASIAPPAFAEPRDVAVVVTGVGDLAAYAAVTDYLESLEAIQAVRVEQLTADAVTYRVRIEVDPGELARMIELDPRLRPTTAGIDASMAGALSYQYQP